MTAMQIIFLLVAAVTLACAALTVTSRRIVHAALWLIAALMGVAIVFALLEASFFVVVQVLVYVGAIAILVLFAVMLTRRAMMDVGPQIRKGWLWAALGSAALFVLMVVLLSGWDKFQTLLAPLPSGSVNVLQLGQALVSPDAFVLPFEVASVLLLAALIGALYIAVERRGGK